jgi:hypothetical protein
MGCLAMLFNVTVVKNILHVMHRGTVAILSIWYLY